MFTAVLLTMIRSDNINEAMVKNIMIALAGVAQWIEHPTANQRVASSIPSQGTCLGCGPGSQLGVLERQPHVDVSLPFFLAPFPSLKINKIFKKRLS